MLAISVRLGAVSLLALAGLLLVPASAHACSCVAVSPAYFMRHADVVLDGVVVARDFPSSSRTTSRGHPVPRWVEVRQVFKGPHVGPVARVRPSVFSGYCGLSLTVGHRYIVYADRSRGGVLRASACGGTRPANGVAVAALARQVGSPHPPDATIRLPERHPAETRKVWGVGGAALALVAMVASGLVVWSRRKT